METNINNNKDIEKQIYYIVGVKNKNKPIVKQVELKKPHKLAFLTKEEALKDFYIAKKIADEKFKHCYKKYIALQQEMGFEIELRVEGETSELYELGIDLTITQNNYVFNYQVEDDLMFKELSLTKEEQKKKIEEEKNRRVARLF